MVNRDPPPKNGEHQRGAYRAPLVEQMPPSLLDEPLAYIFADHFRQRTVCSALRRFVLADKVLREDADAVASFLSKDVPLNHADEEEDLFPAVLRRAQAQDNLGGVLARLVEDHRRSVPIVDSIVAVMSSGTAEAVAVDEAAREAMRLYVSVESSHVAIENGIVLAFARMRLTEADLEGMSRSMKARRGATH
jgi:hemerythrin-like domain-containing protein